MATTPLLHIGYHKTGTSWVQRHLFRNPAAGFRTPFDKARDLPEHLIYPNSLDFDVESARTYLLPKVEEVRLTGCVPVVTSERLSGNPHSGGYDSKELANRLAAVFPTGKVLIVIREQISMIISTYGQYIREGGGCTIGKYLNPSERGRSRIPEFDLNHFRYDRLVSHYQDLFGVDRVLVLPYELFCSEPWTFVESIVSFAGSRMPGELSFSRQENPGYSSWSLGWRRILNKLFVRDSVNPSPIIESPAAFRWSRFVLARSEHVVPSAWEQRAEEQLRGVVEANAAGYYRESNRHTQTLIAVRLERFGYEL